ncbi:MAG: hypothetical protein R3C32_07730 [Chloroflexota bacterium]
MWDDSPLGPGRGTGEAAARRWSWPPCWRCSRSSWPLALPPSPGGQRLADATRPSPTAPGPSLAPIDLATACIAAPDAGPVPSGAPPVGVSTVTDTAGTSLDLISVPVGADPAGVAVDATDTYGRVFTAVRASASVDVRYGRSPDLRGACRLPMPGAPNDLAIDDRTGIVLVTIADSPRIVHLDGRADPTRVVGSVDCPARRAVS